MFAKMIISIVIVFSAGAIGYIHAYRYKQRLKQLKDLYLSFQLLETEVFYSIRSLPMAMKRVGEKSHPSICQLFTDAYKTLHSKGGYSVEEAWENAVNDNYMKTSLTVDDREILKDFGKNLGSTDRENQIKNFHFIYLQLEKQQQIAHSIQIKNEKMCKSLGLLIGIAIVIVCI